MPLRGRRIVVTGGTGALGRAVVGRLLAAGALCHVPVFDPAELDDFPHRSDAGVTLSDRIDLTQEAAAESYYGQLPELWGSVHLAGGFDMAPIAETTQRQFAKLHDLNVVTCFLCCREAVKAIRRSGQGGRIVNVAARPALEPRSGKGMIAYAISKAAVAALTQALAEEVAADDIAVNAIVPSIIDTPANRSAMPGANHAAWPKPDELAQMIVPLIGAETATIRGALVTAYGRS